MEATTISKFLIKGYLEIFVNGNGVNNHGGEEEERR